MRSHLIALAALGGLVCAAPASAQIRPTSVEGSIYGGYWEGDATFENAPTFGARLGYNLHRIFGVELTYGFVPTRIYERPDEIRSASGELLNPEDFENDLNNWEDQTVHQLGLDGILHLSYTRLVPYVSAGVGAVIVDDAYFAPNVALGAKYYFTDMLGVRADLRGWLSGSAPSTDTLFAHFEATIGITAQLGGDTDMDGDGIPNAEDACPGEAEDKDEFEDQNGCPDTDNDKDGILDVDDQCPNDAEDEDGEDDEDGCPDVDKDGDGVGDKDDLCVDDPEDKDGFQDEDGCPDADNDADGVPDTADKCADEAEDKDGFQDDDGCPDPDNDQDGIADADDRCPIAGEDKDGFEDEDGCPELDNDRDGVLDAADKCPNEKETINGNEDEDGCPDEGKSLVAVSVTRIEISDKVYFDFDKATIQKRSFNLLNQVALILKANSQITKVRIEGHTDDKGADDYNMKLSQDRAAAVRSYLIEEGGVAAERLVAEGYGETKPAKPNTSKRNRDFNRRVEFTILEPAPAEDGGEQADPGEKKAAEDAGKSK